MARDGPEAQRPVLHPVEGTRLAQGVIGGVRIPEEVGPREVQERGDVGSGLSKRLGHGLSADAGRP